MQANSWSTRKAFKFVIEWKESKACVDCGFYYQYFQIEADHVPGRGSKKFNIGAREVRNYSKQEIQDELAKCDPVCRNCHAARGWARRNFKDMPEMLATFRCFGNSTKQENFLQSALRSKGRAHSMDAQQQSATSPTLSQSLYPQNIQISTGRLRGVNQEAKQQMRNLPSRIQRKIKAMY